MGIRLFDQRTAEMKVNFALLSLFVDASYDPGINLVDCADDYFRPGAAWPLESVANAGKTVRLCQNSQGKPYKFATLYSTTDRIAVYSALRLARFSNKPQYSRPSSTWDYLCNGLCGDEDQQFPRESFYCNLGNVGKDHYDDCDKHQALNDDYYGNTGDLGIDRGHLVPNGIMNHDADAQKATFTLTNICAQYSQFNQNAWRQLECVTREYMIREIDGKEASMLIGTYGTGLVMNEDNPAKRPVRLPAFYWTAWCYSDSYETYSWVYMQANEPDQKQSSGDLFMSVQQFSDLYYEGLL